MDRELESNSEGDASWEIEETADMIPVYGATVKSVIDELRQILKKIKKSALMREKLAEIIKSRPGSRKRATQVILDVKIRWYSTMLMIDRALDTFDDINAVLDHFDLPRLSGRMKKDLGFIQEALTPVRLTMQALCSEKANLIHADRAIAFLFANLEPIDTDFSRALQVEFKAEFAKRRTINSSLIEFLHDPKYDWTIETLIGVRRPTNVQLQNAILNVLKREVESDPPGCEEEDMAPPPLTLGSKDYTQVFSPIGPPGGIASKPPRATANKTKIEFRHHENLQGHGPYLRTCFKRLMTVQPTSVRPERDFSIMNAVCTKIRNSLSPNTLDSLLVLRASLCQPKISQTQP